MYCIGTYMLYKHVCYKEYFIVSRTKQEVDQAKYNKVHIQLAGTPV